MNERTSYNFPHDFTDEIFPSYSKPDQSIDNRMFENYESQIILAKRQRDTYESQAEYSWQ